MHFLGVDLTSSARKPSAFAVVDEMSRLRRLDFFRHDDELLSLASELSPRIIAIDAPLGLPKGLHCLEEDCSCGSDINPKGRAGEMELARMGIGLFFTSKKSIIKPLIYRAIELARRLREEGHTVIEVYPYATKVLVFNDQEVPRKSSKENLPFLRKNLPRLVRGLEPYLGKLNNDLADAVLAAFTAVLHHQGRTDLLGNREEGFIVVPRLA